MYQKSGTGARASPAGQNQNIPDFSPDTSRIARRKSALAAIPGGPWARRLLTAGLESQSTISVRGQPCSRYEPAAPLALRLVAGDLVADRRPSAACESGWLEGIRRCSAWTKRCDGWWSLFIGGPASIEILERRSLSSGCRSMCWEKPLCDSGDTHRLWAHFCITNRHNFVRKISFLRDREAANRVNATQCYSGNAHNLDRKRRTSGRRATTNRWASRRGNPNGHWQIQTDETRRGFVSVRDL